MTFTEFINKRDEEYDCGIFAPPMTDTEALSFLCDYLLGEDWYSPNPISKEQINTEMVQEILRKYSKKYQKELAEERRKWNKNPESEMSFREKMFEFFRKYLNKED